MSQRKSLEPNDDEEVDDEVAAEVTATNEGMPAGELDETPQDPKAVQPPESLDTANARQNSRHAGREERQQRQRRIQGSRRRRIGMFF